MGNHIRTIAILQNSESGGKRKSKYCARSGEKQKVVIVEATAKPVQRGTKASICSFGNLFRNTSQVHLPGFSCDLMLRIDE